MSSEHGGHWWPPFFIVAPLPVVEGGVFAVLWWAIQYVVKLMVFGTFFMGLLWAGVLVLCAVVMLAVALVTAPFR